jgi:inorganic pyrophosphatase
MANLISEGADTFLRTQYIAITLFVILFSVLIAFVVEKKVGEFWVTIAFLIGSITSMASGYIGMWISVRANVRVTKLAHSSLEKAFVAAFQGGSVLGFTLVGLGLLNLVLIIKVYKNNFIQNNVKDRGYEEMFEAIAGYGLGGSAVALFGRVGGGIYTKAADVGADLVGKVVAGLDEDSPMNPGTIADNVGDNVGDIAGMGADLFGSLAESTCACLVISGSSPELIKESGYYFPLIISAGGIIVCIVTSFLSTVIIKANTDFMVNLSLNLQLLVSTILMTPVLWYASTTFLPAKFTLSQTNETVT